MLRVLEFLINLSIFSTDADDVSLKTLPEKLGHGSLVFRLEDSQGRGPYVYYNGKAWTPRQHNAMSGHPSLTDDGLYPFEDYFQAQGDLVRVRCGFKSLDQLNLWFNREEIAELSRLGFSIRQYKIKEGFSSPHQCVFIPED